MKEPVPKLTTEESFSAPLRVRMTDNLSTVVANRIVHEQFKRLAFMSCNKVEQIVVLL